MIEKALEYLKRDTLLHVDMLETIKRGIGEVIYAGNDGVVLLNSGYTYMISVESEETLERACSVIGKRPEVICAHNALFTPLLQEKYGYKHQMECFQCAYMSGEKLDLRASEGIELKPLTIEQLDFVVENYSHNPDRNYILERLEAGMIGAFYGNEIVGFVGTHTEGTMGMLEIVPAYRRRGIAYTLEAAMINYTLDKGFIPHAHIVTTNEASIKLQEKVGMNFSDKTATWMYDE